MQRGYLSALDPLLAGCFSPVPLYLLVCLADGFFADTADVALVFFFFSVGATFLALVAAFRLLVGLLCAELESAAEPSFSVAVVLSSFGTTQVSLSFDTGAIEFRYYGVTDDGGTITIGVENENGRRGLPIPTQDILAGTTTCVRIVNLAVMS